jgi:hypothetical protein
LFSYVSIEERIPTRHQLRRIRKLADQALDRLNPTFCRLYALEGRPSVPSNHIWPPADFVYTKNRDRLLNDDVMGLFLEKLMGAPEVKPLLSDEHFSVDGTLLQAWASHASLKRIDGQEDPPPPPPGPGEGFGAPKEGKKRAKGDFCGIKLSSAIEAMC